MFVDVTSLKPLGLGIMSEPDYDAVLMGWRAPTTSAGAAAVRPPTLTELGQAKMGGVTSAGLWPERVQQQQPQQQQQSAQQQRTVWPPQ